MKQEHKVLFASAPKLDELKYFVGTIDFREKSTAISNFTWQKMQTRRFIETHHDILAAPFERKIPYVHLIFPGNFTNAEVKHFANVTNLTLSGRNPLPKEIFLECFLFTLTVKLSPDWSRIDKYFVRGDFPNAIAASEAITFQLLLKDECFVFSTRVLRLKLPSMNFTDLEVDFETLFKEGFAFIRKKVLVLPNLKAGMAVCLYAKLPPTCPFRSYEEIKAHWKKLYGYNLPSDEANMTFVEVLFKNDGFSYLYPIVCTCPYEPIHFRNTNELKVIDEFSRVLKNKFPKLCGHQIGINTKDDGVFIPVTKLHLASEVVNKANFSLLPPDDKIIQDFQDENTTEYNLTMPCNKGEKRARSPTFSLPSFDQFAPEPVQETFRCFPVFTSKVKAQFGQENPSKKPNSSQVEFSDREFNDSVASKNLHKMSLSSLKKFCKHNGIPYKKNVKKDTVVEKIYNYFN